MKMDLNTILSSERIGTWKDQDQSLIKKTAVREAKVPKPRNTRGRKLTI